MSTINGRKEPRYMVGLDMNELEAADLADSIHEALGSGTNWRSDPSQLRRLGQTLREMLGQPAAEYPPKKPGT